MQHMRLLRVVRRNVLSVCSVTGAASVSARRCATTSYIGVRARERETASSSVPHTLTCRLLSTSADRPTLRRNAVELWKEHVWAQRPGAALRALRSVLQRGTASQGARVDPDDLAACVHLLARAPARGAGVRDAVDLLLQWSDICPSSPPPTELVERVASRAAVRGLLTPATAAALARFPLDGAVQLLLDAAAALRSRGTAHAADLVHEHIAQGRDCTPQVISMVVAALARERRAGAAEALVRACEAGGPQAQSAARDTGTLTALASAAARDREAPDAQKRIAKRIQQHIGEVRIDGPFLSAAVALFARLDQPQCVDEVVEYALSHGLVPDAAVFNAELSHTIQRSTSLDSAVERTLARMRDYGVVSSIATFNIALREAARRGDAESAVGVLGRAVYDAALAPSPATIAHALEAAAAARRPEIIAYTTALASDYGLRRDRRVMHARLIAAAAASHAPQLRAVLREAPGLLSVLALNTAIARVLPTNPALAFLIAEELPSLRVRPNRDTYHLLLRAAGRVGNAALVREVRGDMQRDGLAPDRGTHRALVRAYASAGDIEEAMKQLRHVGDIAGDVEYRAVLYAAAYDKQHHPRVAAIAREMYAGLRSPSERDATLVLRAAASPRERSAALKMLGTDPATA